MRACVYMCTGKVRVGGAEERNNSMLVPSLRDVKSSYLYLWSQLNRNQSRNEELGEIKNNLWERWRKNTRRSQLALEICDTSTTWRMYDVPLVEFVYFVFTHIPGESYSRQFRSLLYLCYIFWALINSLVCWFCTSAPGLVLFQMEKG